MRASSLQSVLDNYEVLLGVWNEALSMQLDVEMRARITGVNTQMHTFDFLFGVSLGNLLLHHTDNLSKTLQHKSLSAAEGQRVAKLTSDVLQSLLNEDHFKNFYARVLLDQVRFQVDAPALPRKWKAPQQFQIGSTDGNFHTCSEDHYRQIYFEALDFVVQAVRGRFDQPGYRVYQNLQELVLKACKGEAYQDELKGVLAIYKNDLSRLELEAQLPLLKPLCKDVCEELVGNFSVHDAVGIFSKVSAAGRTAFSGVWSALKLLLVLPATNPTSERSFSALRRVKTYMRSTMTQEQLNNLMVLHVHKEHCDRLELERVANEFVSGRERRIRMKKKVICYQL